MEALSNIVYEKRSLEYQLASITDLTDRIDFEITTRTIEKVVTPGDYRDATIFRNQFYDFKKEVEAEFPGMEIVLNPLSLSVSCHIGPGALAVACSKKIPELLE